MAKNALLLLLCAFCVTAWSSAYSSPSPTSGRGEFSNQEAQQYIDHLVTRGDLFARAVVSSGLYDKLSREHYPFLLLHVGPTNKSMKRYLAQQGLTEKEFLTHPKLRSFMENHLIVGFVNTREPRPKRDSRRVRTTVNGSKVVLTTGAKLNPRDDRLQFANGVHFSPDRFFSGVNFSPVMFQKQEGQLCVVDAPIINFDWSE